IDEIKEEQKKTRMEVDLAVTAGAQLSTKMDQKMVHLVKVNHDDVGYCRQEVENYTKESLQSHFKKAQVFRLKLQDAMQEKMSQLKAEASKDQAEFMAAMQQHFSKERKGEDQEVEIIEPAVPIPAAPISDVPTPAAPAPAATTPSAQSLASTAKSKNVKDKGSKVPQLDPLLEASFAMLKEQEKKEGKSFYNKERYAETKKTKPTSNQAINKKLDEI
ncbi:hypothetical protein U1Q18_007970, partial [Sarracenia purpurea var. burkii]